MSWPGFLKGWMTGLLVYAQSGFHFLLCFKLAGLLAAHIPSAEVSNASIIAVTFFLMQRSAKRSSPIGPYFPFSISTFQFATVFYSMRQYWQEECWTLPVPADSAEATKEKVASQLENVLLGLLVCMATLHIKRQWKIRSQFASLRLAELLDWVYWGFLLSRRCERPCTPWNVLWNFYVSPSFCLRVHKMCTLRQ